MIRSVYVDCAKSGEPKQSSSARRNNVFIGDVLCGFVCIITCEKLVTESSFGVKVKNCTENYCNANAGNKPSFVRFFQKNDFQKRRMLRNFHQNSQT